MIKDCTKSYNDSEESGVKFSHFDNKIDQLPRIFKREIT